MICYAHDTFVTAHITKATAGVSEIVRRIWRLGEVSKYEDIYLYDPRNAQHRSSSRSPMRLIEGSRVVKVAAALERLLPNVGGPYKSCRRLFTRVARSMALNSAPVFAGIPKS